MAILRRLWSILVNLVMISVRLAFQSVFFVLLGLIAIPTALPRIDPRIIFVSLVVLFNAGSCYECFRKRKPSSRPARFRALVRSHKGIPGTMPWPSSSFPAGSIASSWVASDRLEHLLTDIHTG